MKCAVIYFSLTGNTEKIARAIQIGIQQAAIHCEIFPIKEANPKRLYEYDLIGLGSCFIGGQCPPLPVQVFINNMRFVGGKHIFAFLTHATLWAPYFPIVVPKLKKPGLKVIGWHDWFGSAFGPLGDRTPWLTDGHPDVIDLQEAEAFGREMVLRSQRIYAGDIGLIPEEPSMPTPIQGVSTKPDGKSESPEDFAERIKFSLKYDKAKCLYPKCRLCMDFCPVDGIDLSVEPQVIGKPCMICMMCDQLCPTGAIEVDEKHMKWQRQIEAENQFKERAVERCMKYEAQGIFRRYMPEDKIGWDNQIYQVYNKHPRFVIGKGRPYGVNPLSWSNQVKKREP